LGESIFNRSSRGIRRFGDVQRLLAPQELGSAGHASLQIGSLIQPADSFIEASVARVFSPKNSFTKTVSRTRKLPHPRLIDHLAIADDV
jgi:hypothetical protein